MFLPLPDDGWRLAVNATYQDVMKTFMNLVTASLVLPLFFMKNLLKVPEGQPISALLRPWGYLSWGMLSASLVWCMGFFWSAAKYVKVLSGGASDETWSADSIERFRDWSIRGSVIFFAIGLITLGVFFVRHHDDGRSRVRDEV